MSRGRRTGTQGKSTDGDVLNFREAQAFLNTTRATLYRWINQGRLRAFRAGRQWRFYRADLVKFLELPDVALVSVEEGVVRRALEAVGRWRPEGVAAEAATPLQEETDLSADPASLLAWAILAAATGHGASDIHLDPAATEGAVRFRVDGVLRPVVELPRPLLAAVVTRLKLLAGMDAADHASVQTGRIPTQDEQGLIAHLLVATLPTPRGEKMTLRLLSSAQAQLTLEEVGLSARDRERLEAALRQPTGLILFGGPTGSGKTTVLHAALRHCATPERSLMTVEPAVTHFLPGAVQVQTNPRGGITFAAALRGIMHADPDLVMVADAPDGETATLAVEAALTGHLVMLQLHANDAASAIRRLLDLGVEPFLLASSLVASLNQRLVRRVCTECRAALLPAEDTRREWRERAERGGLHWPEGEPEFVRGEGCEHCRGTGYHGRTAIFELLTVDEEMARLIAQDAGAPELRAAAVRAGMTTLFADGLRRALDGITSPVEVARVTSWMVSGG